MNFLFFGLGSIGQRHVRNLIKIKKKSKIFAFRKKYSTPLLNHKNEKIKGDVEKKHNIVPIKKLEFLKNNNIKIDAAFICNPSNMHVSTAEWCIKRNIPIFVEKPVATNMSDLKKIQKLLKFKNKFINVVGYQLRFNPIIKFIKKYIFDQEKLGKIYNCEIYHGEHVDNFHSYESYKNSYTSKKKLGGGVSLTQIHELDYLNYFYEKYSLLDVKYISQKISNLKLDVEDNYVSIFKYKKLKRNISLAKITCSFLQVPKKRTIFISCELGSLHADLNNSTIKILKPNKKDIVKKFNFNRNDMFVDELKNFLNLIENRGKKRILPSILDDNLANNLAIKIKI
jgi:predicted dehydrogenase